MNSLLAGYRKFRREAWPNDSGHFAELAKGQKPHTLVIACSDLRVDPVTIFSARPGEFFVIRNVASIVPPYDTNGGYHGVSAAIAFAVLNLQVARIVVLGHEHCGGIAAAMSTDTRYVSTPFLSQWVSLLEPAISRCGSSGDHTAVEYEFDQAFPRTPYDVSLHCRADEARRAGTRGRVFPDFGWHVVGARSALARLLAGGRHPVGSRSRYA